MNKITEKQKITQQSINLNSINAEILKEALIESNFLDQVNTPKSLANLVSINFMVQDFLIENDSLDPRSEKARLSRFFQGYYELCKEIQDSKIKVNDISPEKLKKMILQFRGFDNIINTTELLYFYTAVVLLFDSMCQDEITTSKEKSGIVAIINLYNDFLKTLLEKLEL